VLGWNVAGALGALATMTGIMIPSTALSLWATRWGSKRRETRGVRAFTTGLTPLTLGLLLSTGWVLAQPYIAEPSHRWGALALIAITIVVMLRTRLSPMWLVAVGMTAGALGFV
jgi:chromate transporter